MKLLIVALLFMACGNPVTYDAPSYNQYNTGSSESVAIQYDWEFEMYKDGEWSQYRQMSICKDASATNSCSTLTPQYRSRAVRVEIHLVNIHSGYKLLKLESVYFTPSGEARIDFGSYSRTR